MVIAEMQSHTYILVGGYRVAEQSTVNIFFPVRWLQQCSASRYSMFLVAG